MVIINHHFIFWNQKRNQKNNVKKYISWPIAILLTHPIAAKPRNAASASVVSGPATEGGVRRKLGDAWGAGDLPRQVMVMNGEVMVKDGWLMVNNGEFIVGEWLINSLICHLVVDDVFNRWLFCNRWFIMVDWWIIMVNRWLIGGYL